MNRRCEHHAKRLIAAEFRREERAGGKARAAFRVCGKLRCTLMTYAGAAGSKALLRRALSVARAQQPWLRQVKVGVSGAIECSADAEADMAGALATQGGLAFVTELLSLMVSLIGEALTFRLVQEVWPKAAIRESKLEGK